MQHVLIGLLGVLALRSLASAQTSPAAPVSPTDTRTIERPFAEGGRVHLQLASGDYTVRAGASDRVIVRWSAGDEARLKDLRELFVNVRVTGSTAVIVTDGKTRHVDFVIELPARSDVSLRMRAGELRLHGIEGHKDVRMTAGELTIGVRRTAVATTAASAMGRLRCSIEELRASRVATRLPASRPTRRSSSRR